MDIYVYVDETGNLDFDSEGKDGQSPYFGFGTATYYGDHGADLFAGLKLRADVERDGLPLPNGFHATADSHTVRNRMFQEVARQAPRFDTTFLRKSAAYPSIRAGGQMRLYKMAWYLHFKEVVNWISTDPNDRITVIAEQFGTKNRAQLAQSALSDVCRQMNKDIHLSVWDGKSSWGLQVADYGLWAVHRDLQGKRCSWLDPCVKPTLRSTFSPWGK